MNDSSSSAWISSWLAGAGFSAAVAASFSPVSEDASPPSDAAPLSPSMGNSLCSAPLFTVGPRLGQGDASWRVRGRAREQERPLRWNS